MCSSDLHSEEIGFYKYAQYQCTKQLSEVRETCLNAGMKIGLYMDMAVGASPKGFEAWYFSDLFIKGSAGATPDELSPTGQVWNVLGFNPSKLQELGYEPYRRILEANMGYAGCMRIDHVLQLNRLYFHPDNGSKGTFVYYNAQELMAIVALESHLHKTMIIGEDIGSTTDEFRKQMEEYGILSYKVLPFERESNAYYSMRRPEDYQQLSVCATSTHDTPTLINQWNVQDIWQKKKLGFYNESIINRMFDQYASQRESMNWMLEHYGCWEEVGGKKSEHPREEANFVPEKYIQASAAFMARSNSAVMLMPFSDIFGVSEMGNIPGTLDVDMTISEHKSLMEVNGNDGRFYPNWRKKMHIPVEHIEDMDKFREIVAILNKYRHDGNDGRGRYYQFERLGLNNSSTVDFDKAYRIYNILRYREEYQLNQILDHRYSETFKHRLHKRKEEVQELDRVIDAKNKEITDKEEKNVELARDISEKKETMDKIDVIIHDKELDVTAVQILKDVESEKLDKLSIKRREVEETIENLNTQVAEVKDEIGQLDDERSAIKDEIDNMNNRKDNLSKKLDDLEFERFSKEFYIAG